MSHSSQSVTRVGNEKNAGALDQNTLKFLAKVNGLQLELEFMHLGPDIIHAILPDEPAMMKLLEHRERPKMENLAKNTNEKLKPVVTALEPIMVKGLAPRAGTAPEPILVKGLAQLVVMIQMEVTTKDVNHEKILWQHRQSEVMLDEENKQNPGLVIQDHGQMSRPKEIQQIGDTSISNVFSRLCAWELKAKHALLFGNYICDGGTLQQQPWLGCWIVPEFLSLYFK